MPDGSLAKSSTSVSQQMHQRILAALWQIFVHFTAFGRELSDKNQRPFFLLRKSVLLSCCILWGWVQSDSYLFDPLPSLKFKNRQPNFSIPIHLPPFWKICKTGSTDLEISRPGKRKTDWCNIKSNAPSYAKASKQASMFICPINTQSYNIDE